MPGSNAVMSDDMIFFKITSKITVPYTPGSNITNDNYYFKINIAQYNNNTIIINKYNEYTSIIINKNNCNISNSQIELFKHYQLT